MISSSELHYEVAIMHPPSSYNRNCCYESYYENGAVSDANVQVQTSAGVPVSTGKTSDLHLKVKKGPPVKRKPKRTKHNEENDHLRDPHSSYTVPVSMYDVVKLEYGGEPEDCDVDVTCVSEDQQPSKVPVINTSYNHKAAGPGKKQRQLYYRKVDITRGNEIPNKQGLNQDENEIWYYNQRDDCDDRCLS